VTARASSERWPRSDLARTAAARGGLASAAGQARDQRGSPPATRTARFALFSRSLSRPVRWLSKCYGAALALRTIRAPSGIQRVDHGVLLTILANEVRARDKSRRSSPDRTLRDIDMTA